MQTLDDVIRKVYAESPYSVDDLLIDHDLSNKFVAAVNCQRGVESGGNQVRRRLITLRKRGANNGGLRKRKPR